MISATAAGHSTWGPSFFGATGSLHSQAPQSRGSFCILPPSTFCFSLFPVPPHSPNLTFTAAYYKELFIHACMPTGLHLYLLYEKCMEPSWHARPCRCGP